MNEMSPDYVLFLFSLDLFVSIQESISLTKASNLYFFSSVSIRDDVSKVTYHCPIIRIKMETEIVLTSNITSW